MKKKIIIVGIILGFIATAYCSFEIGYARCYYKTHNFECCNLEKGIETRTERYTPNCVELKNNRTPKIIKKDNDYFFVHSAQNYFYVFGINIEPSKPPQIHWWGASSEEILKDCIDK
ncbi:MAG: hypothetical protein GY705_08525 [Bacteroidetes bacterium]|nr:hypothetical protein [Bacteroidota bacterium]